MEVRMDVYLNKIAEEYSNYTVSIAFKDEVGNAVTPTAATWTLIDGNSLVVNSKSDISISSPGSTENINLTSSELTISANDNKRTLIIDYTYNSDYGSGRKKQMRYHFFITRGTA
jgi:hypothetical protein